MWSVIPSLFHVYWALHSIHGFLVIISIHSWWRSLGPGRPSSQRRLIGKIYRILPWFCIALIFYIPGIYLEWPSDPWEHLRRINEWHIIDEVTSHSVWRKTSYFLPYSLTGFTRGVTQLSWLNYYFTGICLLLSWQYYRLARAVGLNKRVAFICVLFSALTFGNSIFSYHRYYGLSSNIFAQIGSIALIRLAVKAATIRLNTGVSKNDLQSFSYLFPSAYTLIKYGTVGVTLCVLIAFNHIQGIGTAGLGICAVVTWRLVAWRLPMIIWLPAIFAVLSIIVILWFPRHPALDEVYRTDGWLNAWYGFNFYSAASPSVERALNIFGIVGMINLFVGVWLVVRWNHVVGWLTLMPVIVLGLPCFALPIAHLLATNSLSPGNIVIFHRFLLGIPAGLAIVYAASRLATFSNLRIPPIYSKLLFGAAACGGLMVFLILGPERPIFNRVWDSLRIPPSDLEYRSNLNLQPVARESGQKGTTGRQVRYMGNQAFRYMSSSGQTDLWPTEFSDQSRIIWDTPSRSLNLMISENRTAVATLTSSIAPLNLDPLFSRTDEWLVTPRSEEVEWARITDFAATSTAIQNRLGARAELLSAQLISVDQFKTYKIEVSLRLLSQVNSATYLAVAWYDSQGNLLPAIEPIPQGAGSPAGWNNGTYSYFGLVGQSPPVDWTTYRTSFGTQGYAAIPERAAFLRIGLLLNFQQSLTGLVQATNFLLWETSSSGEPVDGIFSQEISRLVYLPSPLRSFTSSSQAGYLSGHWRPIEAILLSSGFSELSETAKNTTQIYRSDRVLSRND